MNIIPGKIKLRAIKLILLITAIMSLAFFGIIQNQPIPALAIILTLVIILIFNALAVINRLSRAIGHLESVKKLWKMVEIVMKCLFKLQQ